MPLIGFVIYNMKKKVLVFIILCFCSVIFAQAAGTSNSFSTIQNLLKEGIDENFVEILDCAGTISDAQKRSLYSEFKKQDIGPCFLNLAGFGIGSFVQGNIRGGVGQLIVQSVGCVMAGFGYGFAFSGDSPNIDMVILGSAGILAIVAGEAIGAIVPFRFAREFNETLAQALRLDSADLSVVPLIRPDGRGGIALGGKFYF